MVSRWYNFKKMNKGESMQEEGGKYFKKRGKAPTPYDMTEKGRQGEYLERKNI